MKRNIVDGETHKATEEKEIVDIYNNVPAQAHLSPPKNNYKIIALVAASALFIAGFILYKKQHRKLGKTLMTTSIGMFGVKIPVLPSFL